MVFVDIWVNEETGWQGACKQQLSWTMQINCWRVTQWLTMKSGCISCSVNSLVMISWLDFYIWDCMYSAGAVRDIWKYIFGGCCLSRVDKSGKCLEISPLHTDHTNTDDYCETRCYWSSILWKQVYLEHQLQCWQLRWLLCLQLPPNHNL